MLDQNPKIQNHIAVFLQNGLIKKIPYILQKFNLKLHDIILVTDENIWNHNSQFFEENFVKKFGDFLILKNPQADENSVNKIIYKSQNYRFILAFGSGTINDLCKYSAKKLNINYAIITSALSMNGYVSKNASITVKKHKKTLEAKLPIAVFSDYKILQNAPANLNKAGLADVLCFYSCYFDLAINEQIFLNKNCDYAIKMQLKIIKKFEQNLANLKFNDRNFLKFLHKMIINSGWAMTCAKSSSVASQSEHLLAHLLQMQHSFFKNELHGELVAKTTIECLKLQEIFLEYFEKNIFLDFFDNFLQEILQIEFSKKIFDNFEIETALEMVKEYKLKRDYIANNYQKIQKNLQKNHDNIYKILIKSSTKVDFLENIFKKFDVKYEFDFSEVGFSKIQLEQSKILAKFIRNRITILDFNFNIY